VIHSQEHYDSGRPCFLVQSYREGVYLQVLMAIG
jgi:hypothetical protein